MGICGTEITMNKNIIANDMENDGDSHSVSDIDFAEIETAMVNSLKPAVLELSIMFRDLASDSLRTRSSARQAFARRLRAATRDVLVGIWNKAIDELLSDGAVDLTEAYVLKIIN